MSLILALGALYVTGKVLAEAGRDVKKIPARKQIHEDSKQGNFDVVKNLEEILYVCDVKRKKHNSSVRVLPYTGYEQCMEYIRNHHLTSKADEDRFIHYYKKVLSKEISKRQSEWDQKYFEVEKQVKAMMKTDEFEMVRYTYFDVFMSREDVEAKVRDLCANTFLGDLLVGQVKIKEETNQSFTEIWGLKVPLSMKYSLKEYYEVSANRCGYIR